MQNIINKKGYIFLLHLVFGYLMINATISKSLSILLLFVGFMSILWNKNKNQEALLWSAYVVGSEVLFRMSKGLIFHELPKYPDTGNTNFTSRKRLKSPFQK